MRDTPSGKSQGKLPKLSSVHVYIEFLYSFTAKPEELVNEQKLKTWMTHNYAKRTASIQKEFQNKHAQGTLDFEVFKKFVAEKTSGYKPRYRILEAKTVETVFHELFAGQHINQHNTDLLEKILRVYGGRELHKEREELANFEQQRDFVELSLKVADTVKEQCTITDLKICVLSIPNRFGSYYSRLENETDVYNAVWTLSDWEHPRLLKRIVRHYCPQHKDLIESYSHKFASTEQVPELPACELLEHQEKFTGLLMTIAHDLNRSHNFLNDFPLSETYLELQLAPIKENTASGILLALLPFCGYQNLHLLREIVHKYCSRTTAQKLDTFTTQWNSFADKTTIKAIYDTQLDKIPLQLSARRVSTITLHLQGEDWKNPTLSQISGLALFLADALKLKPWSVVPYRTILTGSETDAKGPCKVELLASTTTACKLMEEGASQKGSLTEMLKKKTISYIEVEEKLEDEDESVYHLSCTTESITTIYRQATKHTHLRSYFESSPSPTLSSKPLTPQQSPSSNQPHPFNPPLPTSPQKQQISSDAPSKLRSSLPTPTPLPLTIPSASTRSPTSHSLSLPPAPPLQCHKERKAFLHWKSGYYKRKRPYETQYRSCPQPHRSPPEPHEMPYRSPPQPYSSCTQPYRSGPQRGRSYPQPYRFCTQPYTSYTQPYRSYTQPYRSCTQPYRSRPQRGRSPPRPYRASPQSHRSWQHISPTQPRRSWSHK